MAAGSGRSTQSVLVDFLRAAIQPRIVLARPGYVRSGCARSTGFCGPVWEPGDTPAIDDAYINNRPAPAALAGAGPTHARTGTRIATNRSPSATPS